MKTASKKELKELYDKDFPLWVEINLQLLREKAYELVDWENLLEEIEDMARSDLKTCISYLAVILEHLKNARREINILLTEYPSLRNKLPLQMDRAWIRAVAKLEDWLEDRGIDPKAYPIPEKCPYTYEKAMTRDLRREL